MRNLLVLAILAAVGCGGPDVSRFIGARCNANADCDERCLGPSPDYPLGLCSISCDSDADCPGDTSCTNDSGGVCLYTCVVNADCDFLGAGWTCQNRDGRPSGQVMVCRGG